MKYKLKIFHDKLMEYEKKKGVKKYSTNIIPALLMLYFKNSVYASHHESVLNALSTGTCPLYRK